MLGRRSPFGRPHRASCALVVVAVWLLAMPVAGEGPTPPARPSTSTGLNLTPPSNMPPGELSPGSVPPGTIASGNVPQVPDEMVVDVRLVGIQAIPMNKVLPLIRTRIGRPFDLAIVESDVRRMTQSRMFVNVKTYSQRVEGGRVVVFEVVERPTMRYVHFKGNVGIKLKTLKKESGLKAGDAFDTYAVEEGRRKLENFYHDKGYSRARVTVLEGSRPGDQGVEFLINEGQKQRVLWTDFVGNTIATDSRLRTQIQSKPGFIWLFKGEVDRKKIDEDIEKLTAYYRGLGFFQAKIGRELRFNEAQNWLTLTFVINEGVRYKVRNVSIAGNTKFGNEDLMAKLSLKSGQYFNQAQMTKDVGSIQETYGGIGYVFADVKADPRFLEDPGQLDLVYKIREGDRCRVGKININIEGDATRTQITTVINRLSLRPGDIVDIREVRASERRLQASGLFLADPAAGAKPKIAFSPPESEDGEGERKKSEVAREPNRPPGFRGQSPDPSPENYWSQQAAGFRSADRVLDVTISGRLARETAATSAAPAVPASYAAPGQPAQGYPAQSYPAQPYPAQAYPAPAPTNPAALPASPSPPPAPWPSQTMVIRGQYTPDAGYSVPNALPWSSPRSSSTASAAWENYNSSSSGTANPWASNQQTAPARSTQASPAGTVGAAAASSAPAVNGGPTAMSPVTAPAGLGYNRYGSPTATAAGQTVVRTDAGRTAQTVSQGGPAITPPGNGGTPAYANPPAGSAPAVNSPLLDAANATPGMPPAALPPGGQPLFSNSSVFAASTGESDFTRAIPLDVMTRETETGRLMVGVGVNSDAGLLGSVVIDERNFDWTRWPTSWEDIRSGRAWRGAGQGFRIEAVPGTELQRYMINFREPYLFNSDVGLGLSGYYYDRQYSDWIETRVGGRTSLSYQFNHDLSGVFGFRGERVGISDPTVPTPQQLTDALGHHKLFGFEFKLVHDTRDSSFLPTEGHLIDMGVEQVVGDYVYPRVQVDLRRHFKLLERPDGSGRHVLSLVSRFGWTGDKTPIYDHFFAGGYSTLRGFDFRGASPSEMNVYVGGEAMVLGSVEYMFPITADDMLRAVVFCDVGTVEPRFSQWDNNWRVAPGFGLRITIPFMGPAPIALDLAFPVSHEPGDDINNFSFFIGFGR